MAESSFGRSERSVDGARLSVAQVRRGPFQEYVPIQGSVLPSRTDVARLVKDGGVEDFSLQTNLYGEIPFYTEIRWSLQRLNDRTSTLSVKAELVDASGVKINPSHIIVPLTQVLMLGQTVRILPAAIVN